MAHHGCVESSCFAHYFLLHSSVLPFESHATHALNFNSNSAHISTFANLWDESERPCNRGNVRPPTTEGTKEVDDRSDMGLRSDAFEFYSCYFGDIKGQITRFLFISELIDILIFVYIYLILADRS